MASVMAEEDVGGERCFQKVQKIHRASLYFHFCLGSFVQMYVDSCPLCTVLDGACMAMVLYSYAVWFNTGTVYKKKKTPAPSRLNTSAVHHHLLYSRISSIQGFLWLCLVPRKILKIFH